MSNETFSFPPFPAETLGRQPAQGRDGVPLCGWSNDPVASRKTPLNGGGSPGLCSAASVPRVRAERAACLGSFLYYSEVLRFGAVDNGIFRIIWPMFVCSIAFASVNRDVFLPLY